VEWNNRRTKKPHVKGQVYCYLDTCRLRRKCIFFLIYSIDPWI
jgi:hypothetical protein